MTMEFYSHRKERFSNDCRKSKAKVITQINHSRRKWGEEPIRIRINYMELAQGAGKVARTRSDWFWSYFPRDFLNGVLNYFRQSFENYSKTIPSGKAASIFSSPNLEEQ